VDPDAIVSMKGRRTGVVLTPKELPAASKRPAPEAPSSWSFRRWGGGGHYLTGKKRILPHRDLISCCFFMACKGQAAAQCSTPFKPNLAHRGSSGSSGGHR
jgi:hypothetical protein